MDDTEDVVKAYFEKALDSSFEILDGGGVLKGPCVTVPIKDRYGEETEEFFTDLGIFMSPANVIEQRHNKIIYYQYFPGICLENYSSFCGETGYVKISGHEILLLHVVAMFSANHLRLSVRELIEGCLFVS